MGEGLVALYKNKIKPEWKCAFVATFIACIMVHIYKFTNTLPNHDSLYNVYTNQDMTISGRWFLQYVCGISSYFDLPWINGLLCAVYLGITAAVIAEIFVMKNRVVIVLVGLILATCPSTTETLFFEFTADGFLFGLMLSAIAACLSIKGKYVLSGVSLCLSLAIYQAYLSFAIVLCICYFVNQMLNRRMTMQDAGKWIIKHVVTYCLAGMVYYLLWKGILWMTRQTATSYQGISSVGKFSLSTLFDGVIKAVKNIIFFFLEWNIIEHPITVYAALNIVFIICFVAIFFAAIVKSGTYRDVFRCSLIILCMVMSIPMISIWCFASEAVAYRPMMLHSICVLYIFAVILFDKWSGTKISTMFGVFVSIMVFNFAIMANVSYFYLDKCYEKSYYTGIRMMDEIENVRESSEADITEIAFIGTRVEEVVVTPSFPGNRIHILSSLLEEDLLYDNVHAHLYLQNVFGLDIPRITESELDKLEVSAIVQEMGIWPRNDSVTVVGNTIVIKLSEVSE